MTRRETIRHIDWTPGTLNNVDKYRFNARSLLVLAVCFAVTFAAFEWSNGKQSVGLNVRSWVVAIVYLLSFGILNGCIASFRGPWSWTRWSLNVLKATGRALPWLFVTLVVWGGAVAPYVFHGAVYGHGAGWVIFWFVLTYPFGIWLFGVTTRWWVLDDGARLQSKIFRRNAALAWIAGAIAALLIGLPTLWFLYSPLNHGGFWSSLLFWMMFLWTPIAGRVAWTLAYLADGYWIMRGWQIAVGSVLVAGMIVGGAAADRRYAWLTPGPLSQENIGRIPYYFSWADASDYRSWILGGWILHNYTGSKITIVSIQPTNAPHGLKLTDMILIQLARGVRPIDALPWDSHTQAKYKPVHLPYTLPSSSPSYPVSIQPVLLAKIDHDGGFTIHGLLIKYLWQGHRYEDYFPVELFVTTNPKIPYPPPPPLHWPIW